MLAMTQTKPKAAQKRYAPGADEALERWQALEEQRRQLLERIDGIRAALSLAAMPADASDEHGVLTERATPFAGARPRKLRSELEDAEAELEELLPELYDAHAAAVEAEGRELERLAQKLKPKHRAAVDKIADALEALSDACATEAEVRGQLKGRLTGPSAALPNLNFIGVVGRPADWHSPISQWARNARALGYLD